MNELWRRKLILFAGAIWGCVSLAAADETNFVQNAILSANAKMVKVYGASAGQVEGYATGILISDNGQVLTTQGVFLDGSQVRVVTADGQAHQASIIRRDRQHQLALLKIQAATPDFFKIEDTDVGEKGDWVVAIANAFKVADKEEPLSATLGVISLRTSIEAKLTQRDVAYKGDMVLIDQITSNPGSAGGAVVLPDGRLVGVIGKIINSSETNTRLNYAIPNSILAEFVQGKTTESEIESAEKKPVDLGITLFAHGGRNSPAYVDRVIRGGPAYQAKLKSDDLIISIAGEKIGNVREYTNVVDNLPIGQEVIVIVKRGTQLLRLPIIPREKK